MSGVGARCSCLCLMHPLPGSACLHAREGGHAQADFGEGEPLKAPLVRAAMANGGDRRVRTEGPLLRSRAAAQRCLLHPGLSGGDGRGLGPLSSILRIDCRAMDGHVHAFAFFDRVSASILYDSEEDWQLIRGINCPTNRCPPLGHAGMPCRATGGAHSAPLSVIACNHLPGNGRHPQTSQAVQWVPVALPDPRSPWPPRKGQRVSH